MTLQPSKPRSTKWSKETFSKRLTRPQDLIFFLLSNWLNMCIFFKSDSFQPFKKILSYTFFDFLSNVGGLMGLFAGMSILSLVEIFYHLTAIKITLRNIKITPSKTIWIYQNHLIVQLVKYFGKYLDFSDIHGSRYTQSLALSRNSRIFWSILLLSSIVTCYHSISDMLRHAEKSPAATRIATRSASEVSDKF